jgi:hypothetical protein
MIRVIAQKEMRTSNVERRTANVEVKKLHLSLLRRSKFDVRRSTFAFIFAGFALVFTARSHADLQRYDTRYYTIYTDIDSDEEKEAAIRMTKMAEEYHERTKSFAGVITKKFPFYLFKSPSDYFAAGGLPGSAGCFVSIGSAGKLMAIAGKNTSQQTWHVVQHEGFHQFAHAVIGGQIPTWLNEGLAEYFGESIFTGDGFVTGVIPPWRLGRLKTEISGGQLRPLRAIMNVSPQQWADEMNIRNYDQAWSMVHFLVHGNDQKYQGAFSDCIREISAGKSFDTAWADTLGPADGFDQQWKNWWLNQPKSPTSTLYGKAAVATMTSFVARASAARQTFTDFDAFHAAVDGDSLKMDPGDWLPRSLIVTAFRLYGAEPGWELQSVPGRQPAVHLTLADGIRLSGSFVLQGSRVEKVTVDVDDMALRMAEAQALLDSGKKAEAKAMLQASLRELPKSAMADDARKMLQKCR